MPKNDASVAHKYMCIYLFSIQNRYKTQTYMSNSDCGPLSRRNWRISDVRAYGLFPEMFIVAGAIRKCAAIAKNSAK